MQPLFIIYYRLDAGGIQTKIIDIVNYLHEYRHTLPVHIILREKHADDRLNAITNPECTVHYYEDSQLSRLPFCFPIYIICLTLFYRPKSILAFTFIPAICAIWAKMAYFFRRVPVVISEDWSTQDELAIDLNGNFPRLRWIAFRAFYHRADHFCSVNPAISAILNGKYCIPRSKIIEVRNWFTPVNQKIGHIKNKIEYDIVFVGRLEKIKNVPLILSMVKTIAQKRKRLQCCIVGSGSEFGSLKTLVGKYRIGKNVHFTGFSDNPGQYMRKSKIFVLASLNEGLPIALLDAMANRLPVVSMHYQGIDKLIQNGTNGYVCMTENECTNCIIELLGNTKRRSMMGENAYRLVMRQYHWRNIETYLKLLHV
jgi:glycosyltransferase involved in cell wall biosynthesis